MRNIIKLCNNGVCNLRSIVSVCLLYLWAEMTKDYDGGLIWSNENGSDEKLEIIYPILIAVKSNQHEKFAVKNSRYQRT